MTRHRLMVSEQEYSFLQRPCTKVSSNLLQFIVLDFFILAFLDSGEGMAGDLPVIPEFKPTEGNN